MQYFMLKHFVLRKSKILEQEEYTKLSQKHELITGGVEEKLVRNDSQLRKGHQQYHKCQDDNDNNQLSVKYESLQGFNQESKQ